MSSSAILLGSLRVKNVSHLYSRATGPPRVSKNPAQHRKGGGVIIPAEYQVSTPSDYVWEVIRLIETEFNEAPDLKEALTFSVSILPAAYKTILSK